MSDEDRIKVLSRTHPEHERNVSSWQVFLDAFEGSGGFQDGSYLWPYDREEDRSFRNRQAMARYHNYLEALVDLYVRFVFTQGVKRSSQSEQYNEWLLDVDGAGTHINDFLKKVSSMALAAGQAGILVDKTPDEPEGPALADEQGRVLAVTFAPTHVLDWRHGRDVLSAVKLCEDAPQPSIIDGPPEEDAAKQYLIWDETGWARFSGAGQLIDGSTLDLGLVPFVMLRPRPRHRSRMLGRPLVSNANILKSLYNRASEEDEVIRAQAFSVLTVEVGPEGDVNETKTQLGNTVGSAKALVVKGKLDYKTPDQSVPGSIRENASYLAREAYRLAHVRWQRDGLGVESAESIQMQFADLNEMLQGFSKSLAETERAMARAWFAWMTPGDQAAADAAFEAAKVKTEYPDEFFVTDMMAELESLSAALAMDLGPKMAKRIKKRVARRVDPDMTPEEQDEVDAEIDAQQQEHLGAPVIEPDVEPTDDDGEPLPPNPSQARRRGVRQPQRARGE